VAWLHARFDVVFTISPR